MQRLFQSIYLSLIDEFRSRHKTKLSANMHEKNIYITLERLLVGCLISLYMLYTKDSFGNIILLHLHYVVTSICFVSDIIVNDDFYFKYRY